MFLQKLHSTWSKIITLSLYCITLAVFCQVFSSPASAHSTTNPSNRFYFQSFSADYYLSRAEDGTSRLKVVETLVAVFPKTDQNHGITRIIPYTNQDGKNLTMKSDTGLNIDIKHNGITEKPYNITGNDSYFTIHIGDPGQYVHDSQVYELSYEFVNVITNPSDNPEHQELYWDTNGNDWPQRFEQVTARIHFEDEDIEKAFSGEYSCYIGRYGDSGSERCKVTVLDDGIKFSAKNLDAYENLTFNLEFDNGTFVIPDKIYDYRVLGIVGIEMVVAIVLLIIFVVIYSQTKEKREYYNGLFVVPEYTPPRDFTVAEMAKNYVGKKPLASSKVATLIELAVTHKVELSKVGTEKKPRWTIKILSTELNAEQIDLLKILTYRSEDFKVGQELLIQNTDYNPTTTEISTKYTNLQKYDHDVYERLYATKLLEPKRQRKGKETKAKTTPCDVLLAFGIIWVMSCIFFLPFIIDGSLPSYAVSYGGGWLIALMFILAIEITVGAFWISSHFQKFYTHTKEGLNWSRYLDGLKLYIKMAEQDRLKLLQSVKGVDVSNQGIVKLYEKLLPYAIIFRLETSWIKEMEKYYAMKDVKNPDWYSGSIILTAHEFQTIMHHFNNTVLPGASHSGISGSSSGFSGGGGGGFSGGGGGGGGGGGW